MQKISYARYQFPPVIIQHSVWLYLRFPLSYRDAEDLLAEREIDVSYETVRRWALKFGQAYARKLRRSRPRPDCRWHLDEMFVSINGKRIYLWHAVETGAQTAEVQITWISTTLPERSRDRLLSDDEIRLYWNAADAIGWPFGPLFKLLLLTGQRRDEAGEMRWREIDGNERLWTSAGCRRV